jgi:uncharacterized protein (UPF0335 family)
MRVHLQEAAGGDPSSWAGYAVQLVGAGGVGYLLREIVKRVFARADKQDDVAAGLRGEMVRRLERLEKNYAALEEREREWFQRATTLEAENRSLRQRYHALINWIAQQPSLPDPPSWLYERVPGPTEDQSGQRRRATDRPESKP